MNYNFPRWIKLSFGLILAVTATAKIVSSFGAEKLLMYPDPIFKIEFRNLLLIAGLLEFSVALVCFYPGKPRLAGILVAWLSTVLLIYRLGMWLLHWNRPCPCLGNLTDALHVPPQMADTAMKTILAYLLIGSYATLFWLWRQRKKLPQAP